MPVKNAKVIFNSIPSGYPEPGKTTVYDDTEIINLETVPLNGGALVKTLDLAVDPYLRHRMIAASEESYPRPFMPFMLGEPLDGEGVGMVLRSENPKLKAGDHIFGFLKYQQYFVVTDVENFEIIDNPNKLPWSCFVGVLGMPGMTAFTGWREYAQAKKGETVFVSTGAGAVGSLVLQLAKFDGHKVIASAGSDEKVKFMKELGADIAFNYKTTKTVDVLAKEGPIDIYWDNVGGETLENALDAAAIGARFIECGMISGYNQGGAPVKNLFQIVPKAITLYGLYVHHLSPKYVNSFKEFVAPNVESGKIKYKEHTYHGLEQVGEALLDVQKGTNHGKAVVHVANDD